MNELVRLEEYLKGMSSALKHENYNIPEPLEHYELYLKEIIDNTFNVTKGNRTDKILIDFGIKDMPVDYDFELGFPFNLVKSNYSCTAHVKHDINKNVLTIYLLDIDLGKEVTFENFIIGHYANKFIDSSLDKITASFTSEFGVVDYKIHGKLDSPIASKPSISVKFDNVTTFNWYESIDIWTFSFIIQE